MSGSPLNRAVSRSENLGGPGCLFLLLSPFLYLEKPPDPRPITALKSGYPGHDGLHFEVDHIHLVQFLHWKSILSIDFMHSLLYMRTRSRYIVHTYIFRISYVVEEGFFEGKLVLFGERYFYLIS